MREAVIVDVVRTALGDERNIQALKLLTDSFVVYDMDYEVASFYQGFRDGTLPVGTSDYLMYLQLTNAAPELAGRWEIALYPGVTDENGVVQRWTGGAAQSCLIFDSTEMAEEAWRFLQWWMSEKTQTEFAFRLQATMGTEYLWCSANTAAFMNAPWPEQHKRIIAEQMNWIYETPRVPGDYMAERELSNVINAVALNGENLRAQVNEATKRAVDRALHARLALRGVLVEERLALPALARGGLELGEAGSESFLRIRRVDLGHDGVDECRNSGIERAAGVGARDDHVRERGHQTRLRAFEELGRPVRARRAPGAAALQDGERRGSRDGATEHPRRAPQDLAIQMINRLPRARHREPARQRPRAACR